MDHYYSSANLTPDDNNFDDRHPNGEQRLTAADVTQSRYIYQNNQRSLTWKISLTDDQDEVSENALMMHDEPTKVTEKFGPTILKIPAYIRKEADELFNLSEFNPNEIFDMVDFRSSWILPFSYQQYLKSIPLKVLEKRESHVLYPWTLWNKSTGTQHHFTPNRAVASPVNPDRSFLHSPSLSLSSSSSSSSSPSSSSSMSPRYAHVVFGISSNNNSAIISSNSNSSSTSSSRSSDNNGNNTNRSSSSGNNNNNSSSSSSSSSDNSNSNNRLGYCFGEQMSYSSYRGPADEPNNAHCFGSDTTPPLPQQQQQQQRFADYDHRGGAQRPLPTWIARSLSDSDRSMSPPPPPPPFARVYYSVNTDSNTVNKLVEHYCTFCYKNHEPPEVYGSHLVRDAVRTTCPKLRALSCRHCNGTGDNAHTIKYCPFLYANYK